MVGTTTVENRSHRRQRLTIWIARYIDPERDGSCTPTAGVGQIGLFDWSDDEQGAFLDLPD